MLVGAKFRGTPGAHPPAYGHSSGHLSRHRWDECAAARTSHEEKFGLSFLVMYDPYTTYA